MTNLNITRATRADISLLSKLGKVTFTETFAEQNTPDDLAAYLEQSFNNAQLDRELKEEESRFFIAYVNDEPAGYARIRKSEEQHPQLTGKKVVELQRIYALKKFIGKGVGKALLHHCIATAKNSGYEILWLGVWEHNTRAIEFYKHHSFTPFGSHVFMLGNDAQTDILMKRKLL